MKSDAARLGVSLALLFALTSAACGHDPDRADICGFGTGF